MTIFSATRLWFAVTIVLFAAALLVFGGMARDVGVTVAVFGFLGACIRAIGLAVRDNPAGAEFVARRDLFHSALLSEEVRRRHR